MRPITLRVLDQALAQAAQWEAQGLILDVAVNLSAPNLLDARLAGDVERLLSARGVPAQRLVLEITETIVGADPVRVGEVLAALRALGVSLSLDDFGTGSSSLGNLRRLPVDELKIDKSFILGMEDDPEAAAIVRTTIQLAHDLGLRAVAEGIENDAVAQQSAELRMRPRTRLPLRTSNAARCDRRIHAFHRARHLVRPSHRTRVALIPRQPVASVPSPGLAQRHRILSA